MANTDDGGPAFPIRNEYGLVNGISVRDYFAARALPQAIAHERDVRAAMIAPDGFRFDAVAEAAYLMADAMLRAREAKPLADEHTHHYLLDVARMMYVCECGAETSTDPGERMRAHLDTFGGK